MSLTQLGHGNLLSGVTQLAPEPGAGARDTEPTQGPQFAELLAASAQGSAARQHDQQQRQDRTALSAGTPAIPALELSTEVSRMPDAALRQLSVVLWSAVVAGDKMVQLPLRPAHLGRLTLNITVDGAAVYLEAQADDPRVLELLRASLPELAADLARRGLELRGFRQRAAEDAGAGQRPDPSDSGQLPPEQELTTTPGGPLAAEARRSFIEVVI